MPNSNSTRYRIVLTVMLPILLVACGSSKSESTESDQALNSGSAAPSGTNQPAPLPAGHPSMGVAPESIVTPPPPGAGTGAAAITWVVPEGWVEETPSSAMRRAQYRIPGADGGGDAECVVFYFGPGQGGDPMSNAERWASQFAQVDGSDALKTKQIDVGGIPVLTVEVAGTYSGGRAMMGGPSQNLPGFMLLGAIAQGGDANWFFKATGPGSTMLAAKADFDAMIASLAPGA
jgi:hypothetical protein